jgi:DNA mismatch endonuclease, patch repair protein
MTTTRQDAASPWLAGKAPSFKGRKPASPRASKAALGASRKTDSRCEVRFRSLLWRAGARFRKNVPHLPGKPDIVFAGSRLVVFCDGDFWHGRDWEARRRKLARGANPGYWIPKIERNIARDSEDTAQLEALGWRVLRFWESDIHRDAEALTREVLQQLGVDKRLRMA